MMLSVSHVAKASTSHINFRQKYHIFNAQTRPTRNTAHWKRTRETTYKMHKMFGLTEAIWGEISALPKQFGVEFQPYRSNLV